jgi:hypothetical protein
LVHENSLTSKSEFYCSGLLFISALEEKYQKICGKTEEIKRLKIFPIQ